MSLEWFNEVTTQHDANRQPLARSRSLVVLPDSTFWPEGMDYDPRTRCFYVASIKHGSIAVVDKDGSVRELLPKNESYRGSALGVRADAARGAVWATLSDVAAARAGIAAAAPAVLLRIDASTGRIERRFEFPTSERGHTLGDLAMGPAGDVFVTDSNEPFLYRLRSSADTLERITHPLFRSLQGIAPTPDGMVYVADYSHGLLRVDPQSGAVSRVETPPEVTTVGLDGIAWYGGSVIAIQNGLAPARVMRFVLDPAGRRVLRADILDRNSTVADEPTIGAIVGDAFVYVANSQWEKYREDGTRNGLPLARPVLLTLPLR